MNHHNSCINHHKWNIWNLQDLAMVINGMIYSSSWLWKGWFLCLPQFSDLTFPCLIECKSTSSPRRCASWEIVRCATQDWTSQPCPSTQGMKGSRSPGCRLQVGDSSTLISWVWVWIFFAEKGSNCLGIGDKCLRENHSVISGEVSCEMLKRKQLCGYFILLGASRPIALFGKGFRNQPSRFHTCFYLALSIPFPRSLLERPLCFQFLLSWSCRFRGIDTGSSSRWGTWRQILHLVM